MQPADMASNIWRQQQPVGNNNEQIGIKRGKCRGGGGVLSALPDGARRYPWWPHVPAAAGFSHAAARSARWLRIDGQDVVRFCQPVERRDGEVRASHKDDAAGRHDAIRGRRHQCRPGEVP